MIFFVLYVIMGIITDCFALLVYKDLREDLSYDPGFTMPLMFLLLSGWPIVFFTLLLYFILSRVSKMIERKENENEKDD